MSSTGRSLAAASTLGVANQVVAVGIGLFLTPFIVHHLGDHLYGMWSLVAVFVGYYGLLDLGLSTAISRYMSANMASNDLQACNRVFNTAFRLFLLLGTAVLVVSGVFAALASILFKAPADIAIFRKAVIILGVSLALGFPLRVFVGALNSHLRYDLTSMLDLLTLSLRTALTIAVLLLGHKVVGLALATLLASLPLPFFYVHLVFRELPFLRLESKYWSGASARSLLSYSAFSFITQISDILRFQIDAIVVTLFLSLSAVTHYRIAGAIAQYFLGFMLAFMGAFRTVFSRQEGAGDFQAIRITFLFATKISISVSSFIGFGLFVWGKPFIERWMGPSYADAYPCLVALVVGYLIALWQQPSVALMFGVSKHRFLAMVSMAEGIANLFLSVLLARRYGILGVALGTMIPLLITKLLVQPLYVCHIVKVRPLEYFRSAGKSILVVAGSLVVPLLITLKLERPDYGILFITAILSLLCYLPPLLLLVFTADERQLLWKAAWHPRLAAST